jgi:hypothetical protein
MWQLTPLPNPEPWLPIPSHLIRQDHIQAENRRLEEDGQFWAKEIVVRIEYKVGEWGWGKRGVASVDGGGWSWMGSDDGATASPTFLR